MRNLDISLEEYAYGKAMGQAMSRDAKKSLKPAEMAVDALDMLFLDYVNDPRRSIKLDSLQLKGFDLSLAADNLPRAVNFDSLRALGLQKCKHASALLRIMASDKEVATLSLTSLVITNDSTASEDDRNTVPISKVLSRFGSLEYLFISDPKNRSMFPSIEDISQHAATLRFLYLDCPWLGDASTSDWAVISLALGSAFAKCAKLEEVALKSPVDFDGMIISGRGITSLHVSPNS